MDYIFGKFFYMARPAKKTLPVQKVETKVGKSVRVESGDVFIIQKNIPMTGAFRSIGPHLRYPFAEMSAGDSFELKVSSKEIKKKVSNLSSACSSYVKSRNNSSKFTVRRTGPDSVRVWRIK